MKYCLILISNVLKFNIGLSLNSVIALIRVIYIIWIIQEASKCLPPTQHTYTSHQTKKGSPSKLKKPSKWFPMNQKTVLNRLNKALAGKNRKLSAFVRWHNSKLFYASDFLLRRRFSLFLSRSCSFFLRLSIMLISQFLFNAAGARRGASSSFHDVILPRRRAARRGGARVTQISRKMRTSNEGERERDGNRVCRKKKVRIFKELVQKSFTLFSPPCEVATFLQCFSKQTFNKRSGEF